MHKINDVRRRRYRRAHRAGVRPHARSAFRKPTSKPASSASKDEDETLEPRAPVVTIMGHVDHGKTSLLDAIRQTNVVSRRGGRHHAAHRRLSGDDADRRQGHVPRHAGPRGVHRNACPRRQGDGHRRARRGGRRRRHAADDRSHQSRQGRRRADHRGDQQDRQAAGRPEPRASTELLQHEIVVESMGGETLEVPVSALKRTNLDKLLEAIHLQAEILDLKANPDRSAEGIVIEAKLERGRGPVGTVLVQRGTLQRRRYRGRRHVVGPRARTASTTRAPTRRRRGRRSRSRSWASTRPRKPATSSRSSRTKRRAREITDYRVRKRRETLGSAGDAAHARADDADAEGRRPARRIHAARQGRRAGLGRGDRGGARQESATTRLRRGSCIPASAGSPSPTWRWQTPRRRSSSASTCAPTRRQSRRPTRRASRSATTTSSTIWWMT